MNGLESPERLSPRTDAGAPDDAELLRRARAGDEDAFRGLVERYEGIVAATVIGMLGPGADADDVGQEVFVRFYRSMAKFRGESSLKTYLTRIAINLSLNAIKRRKRLIDRFVSRDRGADEAPLLEPAVSAQGEIDTRDTAAVVQAAIASLKPEQRSVVVLRMIDGYSTRETAELLGIPEGTVTSRLARALDVMRSDLRPFVEGSDD